MIAQFIWTANGGNPVSNESKAQLTLGGQLTLQDSSNQQIWSSNISGASYGFMQDNGNFILSSGSSVLWQTFDSPTDTVLPGQILNQDTTIYAKLTEDDYSTGRFKLILQTNGDLVSYAVGFPTTVQYDSYYSTNTTGNIGNNRLLYNETGSLYLLFSNASTVPLLSKPVVTGDNYMRATLDPDGSFRQYTFPKTQPSTGSWSIAGNLIQNLCSRTFNLGSGICGYNGYCTQSDSGLTNCQCPPHYTFIDQTRKYKGCRPDYIPQLCKEGSGPSFAFEAVKRLNWPFSDADKLGPMNQSQCQDECLDDCFCTVAIHNNVGDCWKKKSPLSNGILLQNDDDDDTVALIKYNKLKARSDGSGNWKSSASSDGSGNWKRWVIIVLSILVCSVISNLLRSDGYCIQLNLLK